MVFLLNYLPQIIFLAGLIALYVAWKKKSAKAAAIVAVVVFAILLTLSAVQPSYLPKGTPQRTQLEQFEAEELEMQDRLRKNELNPAERGAHINNRLNVIDKLNERKEQRGEEANR
jgi:glutamine amidotransferase-like uncharacterized protein